jgi:hypothetical protein
VPLQDARNVVIDGEGSAHRDTSSVPHGNDVKASNLIERDCGASATTIVTAKELGRRTRRLTSLRKLRTLRSVVA